MKLSVFEVSSQQEALRRLAILAQKAVLEPEVRRAAVQIVSVCEAKNDLCELQAIFDAVKHGTDRVPGLESGVRYVADPNSADHFVAPKRLLALCREGACGEDCDSQTALVSALCGSIGFSVGLRAWGPARQSDFTHVYTVVKYPKRAPAKRVLGLDTTVPDSKVGWQPPQGRVLTAWIT